MVYDIDLDQGSHRVALHHGSPAGHPVVLQPSQWVGRLLSTEEAPVRSLDAAQLQSLLAASAARATSAPITRNPAP